MDKMEQILNELVARDTENKGVQCAVFMNSGHQMPGYLHKGPVEGSFSMKTALQDKEGNRVEVDAFFLPSAVMFVQIPQEQKIVAATPTIRLR